MSSFSHTKSCAETFSASATNLQAAASLASFGAGIYGLASDYPEENEFHKYGALFLTTLAKRDYIKAVGDGQPLGSTVRNFLACQTLLLSIIQVYQSPISFHYNPSQPLLDHNFIAMSNIFQSQKPLREFRSGPSTASGPSSSNLSRALSPDQLQQLHDAMRQMKEHIDAALRARRVNLQSVQAQLHSVYEVLLNVLIDIAYSRQPQEDEAAYAF